MGIVQNTEETLILNETTMTLHKQEIGLGEFQTVCRHIDRVGQKKLRVIGVPDGTKKATRAIVDSVSKREEGTRRDDVSHCE